MSSSETRDFFSFDTAYAQAVNDTASASFQDCAAENSLPPLPVPSQSSPSPDADSSPSAKKRFPPRTRKSVRTDTALRGLKPEAKAYAVSIALDGHGLFLHVMPNGKKYWRHAFRDPVTRKSSLLGYGVFPEVSLAEALQRAATTRKLIRDGVSPSRHKREEKARQLAEVETDRRTFRAVAEHWLKKINAIKAPVGWVNNQYRLQKYALPAIGDIPVAKLKTKDFIEMLQPLQERGIYSTLRSVRNLCIEIMDYAVTVGHIEFNPLYAVRNVFPIPKVKHFAAVTDAEAFGKLLAKIWTYRGTEEIRNAARLMPYIFCRTGELRHMKWSEVDFDKAEWRYTATKTGQDLIVPLSRQAVEILSLMKTFSGDNPDGWVFPSPRKINHKPINPEILINVLALSGVPKGTMTGHGFRAAAATILEETLGYDPKFINMQLAHVMKDPNGDAYRRAQFLDERREMMQVWADAIDRLREGEDTGTVAWRAKEDKARYAKERKEAAEAKILKQNSIVPATEP